MRLVLLSDTHLCKGLKVPDGEVLIHAGDLTMSGEEKDVWAASIRNVFGRQLPLCIALPHLKCYFAGPVASPKLLPPGLVGWANEETIEQGCSSGSGAGCQGAIPAGLWT